MGRERKTRSVREAPSREEDFLCFSIRASDNLDAFVGAENKSQTLCKQSTWVGTVARGKESFRRGP